MAQRVSETQWRPPQQWQPARYVAFVLPAGEPDNVQMIDLGPAESIDQFIADFRESITGSAEGNRNMVKRRTEPAAPSDTPGVALREAVFDRLRSALGDRRRLLLSPDGALTRLPFEVLPLGGGRRLLDEYQVSYLDAGRDVFRFGAAFTGQPAEPLVVADPDFDLAAGGEPPPLQETGVAAGPSHSPIGRRSRDLERGRYHFGRLPGTHTAGERIAALLGVRPRLDRSALEGSLKQQCQSPRILHLATHGFFLEDQKDDPNQNVGFGAISGAGEMGRLSGPLPENRLLRAGLALAGANTWMKDGALPPEAEDGLLTAEDVSGMDLLATELVVLSACETGLGEVRTGEGVFGLQRAFILAGAQTLVMSLWEVPDEQTQELMIDFYQRILKGEPRADALHAAQQALRAEHPEPFYWGAFVCLDDPGPLRRDG